MKKICFALLLVAIMLVVTACGGSSGKSGSSIISAQPATDAAAESTTEAVAQSSDNIISSEGISIALPEDFSVVDSSYLSEAPQVTTAFQNSDETIVIYAVKELKSEIDPNFTVDDYLQVQFDNLPDDVMGSFTITEDDGVKYYQYSTIAIGSDSYKFFNTAYESEDAFWLLQFACAYDDYDANKADFIKWAKTVSFS